MTTICAVVEPPEPDWPLAAEPDPALPDPALPEPPEEPDAVPPPETWSPGTIDTVYDIGIPRPRTAEVTRSPEFHRLVDDITEKLFVGAAPSGEVPDEH
jgi:hypothetical protein